MNEKIKIVCWLLGREQIIARQECQQEYQDGIAVVQVQKDTCFTWIMAKDEDHYRIGIKLRGKANKTKVEMNNKQQEVYIFSYSLKNYTEDQFKIN